MNKQIFIVVGILVASVGTGGCTTKIYSFDQKTYNSWDDMIRQVFDYRDMTWTENGDEISTECYENLPTVEMVEEGCWEGAVACHYWAKEENRWKIQVQTKYRDTCEKQVHSLYHEFTHHFLKCNYKQGGHPDEYFDVYEYWLAIHNIQQEICE